MAKQTSKRESALAKAWRKSRQVRGLGDVMLLLRIASDLFTLLRLRRGTQLGTIMARMRPVRPEGVPADPERREKLVRYVNFLVRTNPLCYGNQCFFKTVLLFRYLRLGGVPAVVNFGVRKLDDRVEGHMWVTVDERIVNDSPELIATFTRMYASDGEVILETGGGVP